MSDAVLSDFPAAAVSGGFVAALPAPSWPLLDGSKAVFPAGTAVDLPALAAELASALERLSVAGAEDPFANPVLRLSVELSRRIDRGELGYGTLEQLIQYLTADGFLRRAERLSRYVGETDPGVNAARLRALLMGLARPDPEAEPVAFEVFKAAVEREVFGIVITAHPTFNLSGVLMEMLTTLATGRTGSGGVLDEAGRAALIQAMSGRIHRPETMSLSREHELSLIAIGHIQGALRRLYELVFEVAAEVWPERWTEVSPRLITVASWVGYDLDGRSDITWSDTLQKRLIVQATQLRHYLAEIGAVRGLAPRVEELGHTFDLLESRLALAINEVSEEIEVFSENDPADPTGYRHIQRIAQRMHRGRSLRLVDSAQAIDLINRAIRLVGTVPAVKPALVGRLCCLRAEIANYGLGMAHTHVRINATQLHNAVRKAVGLTTAPDDPRYRQSYLAAINDLLDKVRPVTINFGTIIAERTSAKRLFMVLAQMLKYADATTPVRFLIAECESAFTALTALYYARLFGVEGNLDISPLFETEKALEAGSRVIDQLLENPHFRAYVQARGRLCIQTGFSDAGRYLGQTPASASIERLRMRLVRLFDKHKLKGVQLLIFDTHGESIGRGAHPGGFPDRLSYVATPHSLAFMAEQGVDFKQEVSFQGGDGYLYFVNPAASLAVITRILDYALGGRNAEPDPFYDENDYVTEFFTTVKEFQVSLMEDADYGALLSAFGTNLLFGSGSRAIKRQSDAPAEKDPRMLASQFRAIPHNAILQQLGLAANTLGGVGAAIDKDPERFRQLYARSPRFRQLMGMVEYAVAVANPDALRAYVDTVDPAHWLLRANGTADRAAAEDMRRLAGFLEDMPGHARQLRVYRKLYADFSILRQALPARAAPVDARTATALSLLHAIRLSLIQGIFRLATRVPPFSSQHSTTHERVVSWILHLDVPAAVDHLERIFPETADTVLSGDFGEAATYVSDETQNYHQENEHIFKPMTLLYELLRRTGVGIIHRIGFLG